MRLSGRDWYHWLWPSKRGGLKAKFEGLNFPERLKKEKTNEMIKYSENIEKYALLSIKDLTNDYANAYNVIRKIEESGEDKKMINTERKIEGLKKEIENLRKHLRNSGINRSTLYNVKFNAQEQVREYKKALELSEKEDQLEELENLNLREVN